MSNQILSNKVFDTRIVKLNTVRLSEEKKQPSGSKVIYRVFHIYMPSFALHTHCQN